ncbi:MAG: 3-phosphoshikimate 1-carboxyvinyltransferase, partial [Bacteroidaceae bacterium]|nr:3-phosphoshikimate 1-carboxyvinyltransferase [Bacteroidaceae bacterium]
MDNIKLSFEGQLRGRIVLPASKSISARALIINALSGNTNLPENLSDSDDTQAMLRALANMPGLIDIGAAGTAMRFLTAYLSVTPGTYSITGTERMKHRPIGILVDALRTLGADITYEGEEGFPPLRIVGRNDLEGGELTIAGNVSSQYISALLMIAPTLKKGLRLTLTGQIASRPYIEMTMSMMRNFGAEVEWEASPLREGMEGSVIDVKPGAYQQRPYHIESDWSAASYWYEMVAVSPDADAQIDLVGLHHDSIQGDSKVWQMFRELGVTTQYFVEPDGTEVIRLRKG